MTFSFINRKEAHWQRYDHFRQEIWRRELIRPPLIWGLGTSSGITRARAIAGLGKRPFFPRDGMVKIDPAIGYPAKRHTRRILFRDVGKRFFRLVATCKAFGGRGHIAVRSADGMVLGDWRGLGQN